MKKIKDKLILYGLSLASIINLSACNREIRCADKKSHVHLYTSNNGLSKYSSSEFEYLNDDYSKSDQIKYVDLFELRYYNYLIKNNFLDLELNYDYLKKYFPKIPDCREYEYTYKRLIDTKKIRDEFGNVVDIEEKFKTCFGWCRIVDDKELTGNERIVSCGYMGYKIIYNEERDSFSYERSGYYDSIDELLSAGYTHIKIKTFTRVVDKNNIIKNNSLVLSK